MFRNILNFFLSFQGIKNYVRSIMPEDLMSIKLGTAYVTILQLQEKSTYNCFQTISIAFNCIFKENKILKISNSVNYK